MSVPVQIWLESPNKNNMKQLIKSNAPIIIILLAILGWLLEKEICNAEVTSPNGEVVKHGTLQMSYSSVRI